MSKTDEKKSLFQRCREIDVSDITRKNYQGINYISWADAWNRLKEYFPEATYQEHEFGEINNPNKVPYLLGSAGIWVRVTVNIENTSITESLPVMDNKMQALKTANARDINDNLKRCLVKAMALHGFGLSVYEKDDIHSHPEVTHFSAPKKEEKKGPFEVKSASPSSTEEYRIPFGKHKGKSFEDLGAKEVGNYKNYLERDALAQGKKLFGQALELVKAADLYLTLSSVNEEPPPFDESLQF